MVQKYCKVDCIPSYRTINNYLGNCVTHQFPAQPSTECGTYPLLLNSHVVEGESNAYAPCNF